MKRKEPTQSERLMRALLRGAKVDRYYALNKLRIAHPGARVGELRADMHADARRDYALGYAGPLYRSIRTVSTPGRSYYWIPVQDRSVIREWWEGRKK